MTATEGQELNRVWEQVKNWSAGLQISLARRILDKVDTAGPATPTTPAEPPARRGRPVEELIGLGAGSGPPPSDEQVRQWIDEHRTEKYGP